MEPESATLFVAEVPYNLPESDFVALFRSCEGFIGGRLRSDKNDNRVGFVDFTSHVHAAQAREALQGHKFSDVDEGLNVHFSKATSRPKRVRDDEKFAHSHREATRMPHPASPHLGYVPPSADVSAAAFYGLQPTYPQSAYPAAAYNMPSMYPPLPPDASPTLYVEGLPIDATEREVSHIFRPFTGYASLRILPKESKQFPSRMYHLCFVEFDNKYQATLAMHALQGYRMDKNDTKGLHISYAKSDRKERRRVENRSGQPQQQQHQPQERDQI